MSDEIRALHQKSIDRWAAVKAEVDALARKLGTDPQTKEK